MKKITKEYTVYSLDELSESSKNKAHIDYLNNHFLWPLGDDVHIIIDDIEKLFHISLSRWSIETYRPEFPDIHFEDSFWSAYDSYDRLYLSGNRARAFLWNNFGDILTRPRTRYFCNVDGKRVEAVGLNSVKRTSNIFSTRVYEGTCPITGLYIDCEALDPMAYFCFGVELDGDKKKIVQTKNRSLKHDNYTTVEDVIRDCVHGLFWAFVKDLEYYESMECFEEDCNANEWTFLENGEMMNW